MTLDELKQMDIESICEKDCVLFMWAVVPMLSEAIELLQAWGFKYKTCIFWRKIMSLGMGYWFRGQVEVLMLGIKGNVKAFRSQRCNFIQAKVGKHSQKPYEIYGLIEELDIYPKIELFARHRREGWDAWGNQVPREEQRLLRL